MKPTVITNNSNGSSNGNAPPTTTTNASSGGVGQTPQHHHTSSTTMDSNNNPNVRNQFHNFEGFGFDPDMDDVFSDAGIRSRLNRMPFSFGSRKRVNDPNRYFNTDDDDFFSHFGSLSRRRHPQTDRSGIFEHIPAEFRQYMPDAFEFPSNMRNTPQSPRYSASQPTQSPPQYYKTYTQPGPGSPTANQPQPKPQKPKLCDAAIQTENSLDETTQQPNKTHKTQPLKQHGLRNTVDLGQISPPENESFPRAQSAPPIDPSKQNFTNSSVASGPDPDQTHASATAYAYIPPPQQQRWQPQSPPPSAQHKPQIPHPPPRSMPQQQYYQSAAQSPQPQSSSQPGSATIRTVPIFVEGRSEPVINEHKYPTFESHTSTQQEAPPYVQKQFCPQQHSSQYQQPQASQYQPYQQYQQQSHPQQQAPRPTPLNTQQANAASDQQSPVPNTPQTTATIEKIQSIQRDVLDLMSKVEKFKGMKADKEYMYLDEMLTRNLLKLDTIDTQGKERIRLARKEAIKCIQASINVLEAKAEENAKTAQKSAMHAQDEINTSTVPQTEKTENIDNDARNTKIPTTTTVLDEASTAKLPDVVPLPPPPSPPQSQPSSTNQLTSENQQMTENEEKSNSDQNIVELEIEKQQDQPKSKDSETNKTEAEIINIEQKQQDEDESTSALQSNNDDITTNNVPTPVVVAVYQQENKERSKESPKKKIIKKILKKSEKKDKKELAAVTPSSETQEITTSSSPSEISKDCN